MGYELGGCFERLPVSRYDEFHLPVLAAGLYDWVIAWDHVMNHGHGSFRKVGRRRMRLVARIVRRID